jgi:hypothetical protein
MHTGACISAGTTPAVSTVVKGRDAYGSMHVGEHAGGFHYRGREGMHTGGCISAGTPAVSTIGGGKGCMREDASRDQRQKIPIQREGRDASSHTEAYEAGMHLSVTAN